MKLKWNKGDMKIAIGLNRKEKDFAGMGISAGKFFIGDKHNIDAEKEAALFCIRQGVEVVVLSKADLGRGMGQVNYIKAIEKAGGVLSVCEGDAQTHEPFSADSLTIDQTSQICNIWGNNALSEATRLARIGDIKPMSKNQVHYLCVTKKKRAAEKPITKGDSDE